MEIKWYNPNIKSPTVSIASYGLIFSNGAIEVLNSPKYILLGFSKEESILYIKPTDAKTETAIEFYSKFDTRSNYIRINDKNFVKFLESQLADEWKFTNRVIKFDAKWDEENELLLVKIDKSLENDEED